jgi:hypothetical protein
MKTLHLSDIHFCPQQDGRSSKQVRQALPQYLEELHVSADHVFVTGNLRHAGLHPDKSIVCII